MPFSQGGAGQWRQGRGGLQPVPLGMPAPQCGRGLQPLEKGVQLGVVCVVMLRINLPHEGLARPECTHQRVFSAHEIQVAGPEHFIEVGLGAGREV